MQEENKKKDQLDQGDGMAGEKKRPSRGTSWFSMKPRSTATTRTIKARWPPRRAGKDGDWDIIGAGVRAVGKRLLGECSRECSRRGRQPSRWQAVGSQLTGQAGRKSPRMTGSVSMRRRARWGVNSVNEPLVERSKENQALREARGTRPPAIHTWYW